MSFTLHGLAISGGIAIGQAHLISQATLEVSHLVIAPRMVEKEVARLETALTRHGQALSVLEGRLAGLGAEARRLEALMARAAGPG